MNDLDRFADQRLADATLLWTNELVAAQRYIDQTAGTATLDVIHLALLVANIERARMQFAELLA